MLIQKECKAEKKVQCRIRISESLFEEITAYCDWAGIKFRDYFIEQCCKYIFSNDEEWKAFKNEKKSSA